MTIKKIFSSTFALILLVAIVCTSLPLFSLKSEAIASEIIVKSEAYRTVYEGLMKQQERIDVSKYNLNKDTLSLLMQDLFDTEGELFFVAKGYSYSLYGSKVAEIIPNYSYKGVEYAELKDTYDRSLQEILDLGSGNWDDLELVTFYHDYIASHYEYDTTYQNGDAFSMLRDKKGVCQAYTLLFHEIMEYYKIPCTYARSTQINHIWNVVAVDGEWYHSDITWDDPVNDRPGMARHTHFLLGESQNKAAHKNATDIFTGDEVTASQSNHPYMDLWDDVEAPIVPCGGSFYAIKQEKNEMPKLSKLDLVKGTVGATSAKLSDKWYVVGELSYYPGNYSGLATDGISLYYNGFDGQKAAVYRYHPERDEEEKCAIYDEQTRLFGLCFEEGKLQLFKGQTPNDQVYEKIECTFTELQIFTITWVVDGVSTPTTVQEGMMPEFNGSTWKENEGGKKYTFLGWSPKVVPATENATYTAEYLIEKTYVPGDINGDEDVNISDVTLLLNVLSGHSVSYNTVAADPNGDGIHSIADVTALLNYLQDHSFELN